MKASKLPYRFSLSSMKSFCFILLVCLLSLQVSGEGTKEIMPTANSKGRLQIGASFSNFAQFGCALEDRLNISVKFAGEKINFGFGDIVDQPQTNQNDVHYQLRDPLGNIVISSTLIPSSGFGYIQNYSAAVNGPSTVSSFGYAAISYTSLMAGDYYLEFTIPGATSNTYREFEFFDITVTNPGNIASVGRVWSKAWQFTVSQSPGSNLWNHPFNGKLYVYSVDSIVTSVDFNGMKPLVFTLSANSTGVANSGNPLVDRKSVGYQSTYPQYKIFLNDPDSSVYPSGSYGAFTAPTKVVGCPGNFNIHISVNKPGSAEILINLNGIPGYQVGTQDILTTSNLSAGLNFVPWNGIDGLGNIVPSGIYIDIIVSYIGGLTHLPMYDVETNDNGFIVKLERPTAPNSQLYLYWDDSNFPTFTTPPSNGCSSLSGCHDFGTMYGDQRTINTWWYSSTDIKDSVRFLNSYLVIDSIHIYDSWCVSSADGSIEIYASGGYPPIQYSINSGPFQSNSLFLNQSPGTYVVEVRDSLNCIQTDTINIGTITNIIAPSSSFTIPDSICTGIPFQLNYTGNGVSTDTYIWDFGNAQVLSGSGSGPYQLQLSNLGNNQIELLVDRDSCVSTKTVRSIFVLQSPTATFNVDSNHCDGDTIVVEYTGSAAAGSIYNWNFPGATIISGVGQGPYSLIYAAPGSYNISLEVTQLSCNSGIYSRQIQVYDVPTSTFIIGAQICLGDTFTANYTGNASSGAAYNWTFSNGSIVSGTGQGPLTIVYNSSGTYNASLVVSENGCSSFSNQSVNVKILPSADFVVDSPSCYHLPVLLNYTGTALSNAQYNWNFGSGVLISGIGAGPYQISWPTEGSYPVTLQVIENACTSSVTTQDADLYKIQPFVAQKKHVSCFNGNDAFLGIDMANGISPFQFQWLPNVGNQANLSNLSAGIYTVFIEDSLGCLDTLSTEIVQPDSLEVLLTVQKTSCIYNCDGQMEATAFGGTPPYQYQWVGTNPINNTSVLDLACSGYHTITVTDSKLCTINLTDSIGVNSMIEADFNYYSVSSYLDEYNVDFTFTGYGAATYDWDFGDGSSSNNQDPFHTYIDDNPKLVQLIVNSGIPDFCVDTAVKTIEVLPPFVVYVPNTFTPNNDGQNDIFRVVAPQVREFDMMIFDRWGAMIYRSSNISAGWDGRVMGELAPEGAYIYLIKIIGEREDVHEKRGSITLLR